MLGVPHRAPFSFLGRSTCWHPPRRRQHRAALELLRRRREKIGRDRESDYCYLMIPMYFDPFRYPASVAGTATEDPETGEPFQGNDIGWIACWRDTSKSVGKRIVVSRHLIEGRSGRRLRRIAITMSSPRYVSFD